LYECPADVLNDDVFIQTSLKNAVAHANATLLEQVSRRFEPQGVTAVAVLAESHMSIHTWPEFGYAAVDVFTCGSHAIPKRACEYLIQTLNPGRHSLKRVERGGELRIANAQFAPKPVAAAIDTAGV
jgi:S-adenosylmethionine decarboxylase